MATAMTAPAAGAVVEERSRDGATADDRSLNKLNALENWAHIKSSLDNKQACDFVLPPFFLRNKNQPKITRPPGRERQSMGMDYLEGERKRSGSFGNCFCGWRV